MNDRRPFRGSQARRELAYTRAELRGPRFVPLFRDVFVSASAEIDLVMRAEAALLVHPTGVVGGVAGAAVWGSAYDAVDAEVDVWVTTSGARSQAGLRAHRGFVPGHEISAVRGIRVTTPVRTALDLARWLPHPEAVVALDALARAAGIGPAEIARAAAERTGGPGTRAVQRAVELMDPCAISATWSRARLALLLRGVPAPVVAYQLPDAGPVLELAWPDHRYGLRGPLPGPPRAETDVPPGWRIDRVDPARAVEQADRFATAVTRGLRDAPRRAAIASAERIGQL